MVTGIKIRKRQSIPKTQGSVCSQYLEKEKVTIYIIISPPKGELGGLLTRSSLSSVFFLLNHHKAVQVQKTTL